jgi:hypothetical protein
MRLTMSEFKFGIVVPTELSLSHLTDSFAASIWITRAA